MKNFFKTYLPFTGNEIKRDLAYKGAFLFRYLASALTIKMRNIFEMALSCIENKEKSSPFGLLFLKGRVFVLFYSKMDCFSKLGRGACGWFRGYAAGGK